MKKEKMIYKAYAHFYSMRLRCYMKKEAQMNLYAELMLNYCEKHGYDVSRADILAFLDKQVPNDPRRKHVA